MLLRNRLFWLLFSINTFGGAFLTFQLEPLIGRFILPWFGGSPSVWTTCMLFFQVLLLAGYSYAHLSLSRLKPMQQATLQILLLLAAAYSLPIAPDPGWKPEGSELPTLRVILLLLTSVGLPYFVLTSTSPLLQAWFVRIFPTLSPYPLYALSNLGSLFALLSYPILFEPYFGLGEQNRYWSAGFAVFVLLCGLLAVGYRQLAPTAAIDAAPSELDGVRRCDDLPPWLRWFLWLALPAAASVLLLAVTNQLCQDIASIPFLWILPLSLYLFSFVLCFAHRNWYWRSLFIPALVAGTFGLVTALYQGSGLSLEWQIGIYCGGLFFCCMTCHGELFRLRPHPQQLTAFYLAIAAGGAIGGVFVGVIAPLAFSLYFEFHIGLLACCALTLLALRLDSGARTGQKHLRPIWIGAVLALLFLGVRLGYQAYQTVSDKTLISRNFYGVLRVEQRGQDEGELRRVLRHGAVDHGVQFLAAEKRQLPAAYYNPESGVGLAFRYFPRSSNRRIGVVGMGIGTLLAYGKPGDNFQLYEINPAVVQVARDYFTFLADSRAAYTVAEGDARLTLERQAPANFDLLVLDAFSGDAIPIHLLTSEALALYIHHLAADGALLINISNHYLDLKPLVKGLADYYGYPFRIIHSDAAPGNLHYASDWALLTHNQALLQTDAIDAAALKTPVPGTSLLWTDAFSNLYRLLK